MYDNFDREAFAVCINQLIMKAASMSSIDNVVVRLLLFGAETSHQLVDENQKTRFGKVVPQFTSLKGYHSASTRSSKVPMGGIPAQYRQLGDKCSSWEKREVPETIDQWSAAVYGKQRDKTARKRVRT